MISKHCVLSMLVAAFIVCLACSKKNPLKPEEKKCNIPDQLCDSALLVVGNKTSDTIHFNKGESGPYYMSVKPGGTTTFKTSGTDVRFNSDCTIYHFSGPIEGLQIPGKYFSVKMNRCNKKVYFIKNGNSIDLEIEDKD